MSPIRKRRASGDPARGWVKLPPGSPVEKIVGNRGGEDFWGPLRVFDWDRLLASLSTAEFQTLEPFLRSMVLSTQRLIVTTNEWKPLLEIPLESIVGTQFRRIRGDFSPAEAFVRIDVQKRGVDPPATYRWATLLEPAKSLAAEIERLTRIRKVIVSGNIPLLDREATMTWLKEAAATGQFIVPNIAAQDESRDPKKLPQPPVAGWHECPDCRGALLVVEDAVECADCRGIWCDGRREPRLDPEGYLVGTDERLPKSWNIETWDRVGTFMRLRSPPPPLSLGGSTE